jgi:DNA-binding NarL/FixJ family response regulator
MSSVRLLVAGGHEILRIGVRAILANNPDWTVVAEASDGQQAIEKAKEFRPDIAILDFNMPGTNRFDAAQEIVKNLPDTKVLMLTIYDGDALIEEMQRAGAHGCLRKADVSRDLICAIETLLQKKRFYPPAVTTIRQRGPRTGDQKPLPSLTARQKEIVRLLVQGRTSKEIAATLGISVKTVETHRNNIHLRTNCHTMAYLVRYAIRNGIIVA